MKRCCVEETEDVYHQDTSCGSPTEEIKLIGTIATITGTSTGAGRWTTRLGNTTIALLGQVTDAIEMTDGSITTDPDGHDARHELRSGARLDQHGIRLT